jgi:hypothetical protein
MCESSILEEIIFCGAFCDARVDFDKFRKLFVSLRMLQFFDNLIRASRDRSL